MDLAAEIGLIGFIIVAFLAATGGAIWRPGAWYETIRKPSWRPPNWLFAPVWMVLFGMIAVSGWLVWREVGLVGGGLAFVAYGVQLVLNFFWSGVFFGLKRIGLAALEMAALWIAIAVNIALFHEITPWAAYLLLPYLAWVSFAFVLNIAIWRLNASAQAGGDQDGESHDGGRRATAA